MFITFTTCSIGTDFSASMEIQGSSLFFNSSTSLLSKREKGVTLVFK